MLISKSTVRSAQRGPRVRMSEADHMFLVHTQRIFACKFLFAPLKTFRPKLLTGATAVSLEI